jgi:hypothetical protein
MTPQNPGYPVRLEIAYPERLNRLLPLVKWLLLIPHYLVLWVLGIAALVVLAISSCAVLITGSYPLGLFNFLVGFERWRVRVGAYLLLQSDQYPPFSLDDDPSYPVRFEVDYPQRIARWRPLVNWLLATPAFIGTVVLSLVASVAVFIAFFAILFTRRYPQGLFSAVTIAERWGARALLFSYWMTEEYPPFVCA